MFGSRLLLSVAAFVLGGVITFTMLSWGMIDPVYPYRLGLIETVLYFAAAAVPAVFWLSIFCRDRKIQRYHR